MTEISKQAAYRARQQQRIAHADQLEAAVREVLDFLGDKDKPRTNVVRAKLQAALVPPVMEGEASPS